MTAMKEANVVTQPPERLIMQPSTREVNTATTPLQRLLLRPSHCEANVDLTGPETDSSECCIMYASRGVRESKSCNQTTRKLYAANQIVFKPEID
jgi:hypothetical protein